MTRAALAILLLSVAGCSGNRLAAPTCPASDAEPANVAGLAPVVWDDQRSTYLRFPGNQQVPAITALRMDGAERAVNFTANPAAGTVMVHGVYPAIILRDGKRVACIRNGAFDQVGISLP